MAITVTVQKLVERALVGTLYIVKLFVSTVVNIFRYVIKRDVGKKHADSLEWKMTFFFVTNDKYRTSLMSK